MTPVSSRVSNCSLTAAEPDLTVDRRPFSACFQDTLRNFGAAVIRLALSKEQVALVRVVGMESAKFPELGKRFYELGPKRGEEALAAYLKNWGFLRE